MSAVRCPGCKTAFTVSPAQSMSSAVTCPHCGRSGSLGQTVVRAKPDQGSRVSQRESSCTPGATAVRPKPEEGTGAWSGSVGAGAPAPTEPTVAPGAMIGNRFKVEKELGKGAFGVVYKALDTQVNDRPVAIKVLYGRALANPDAIDRFEKEGEILLQIDHSNVPKVVFLGQYSGQRYIVIEFVTGVTVDNLIKSRKWLDPIGAVRMVAKLVRTLDDIYREWNIIHRDVKPGNMMVPSVQEDGLYLMDFGLGVCDQSDATRTQDGTMLGTPAYMSPEQASGKVSETKHPADLYSAAATLYHLLTGRPPFLGDSSTAVLIAQCVDRPEPPSKHRTELKTELGVELVAALDAIVLKGLEKKAEDRYANGREFAEELELWVSRVQLRGHGTGVLGTGPQYSVPANPLPGLATVSVGTKSVLTARPLPQKSKGAEESVIGGSTIRAHRLPATQPKPAPKRASYPEPELEFSPTAPVNKSRRTARAKDALDDREYRSLAVKLGLVFGLLVLLVGVGYLTWKVINFKPVPVTPTTEKQFPKSGG